MFDIRALVQTTLDTALASTVKSHWNQRTGPDADEYIVYSLEGTDYSEHADNVGLLRDFSAVIRYYYQANKLLTSAGRAAIKARENQILAALEAAGFDVSGPYDIGPDNAANYDAILFDCVYQVVV